MPILHVFALLPFRCHNISHISLDVNHQFAPHHHEIPTIIPSSSQSYTPKRRHSEFISIHSAREYVRYRRPAKILGSIEEKNIEPDGRRHMEMRKR